MSKYKAWILLILCNLFWAGNYIFGKYVVAEITPVWITFLRWVGASIILLILAQFIEKPDWKVVKRSLPQLVLLGVLGIIGYNILLYSALNYTSSTNAALVNALNPGLIVVFAAVFYRERISKVQYLGVLVSLIGVFVILTKGRLDQIIQLDYNRGDLIMIGAIVVWTLYSFLGKRLSEIPPITTTGVSGALAAIMLLPFAIKSGINLSQISSLAKIGILYMIIFPSVGSFLFWNISVRKIGASEAGVFMNLNPVFTAIISSILGVRITMTQIIGGLFVFLGVYLTTGLIKRKNLNK